MIGHKRTEECSPADLTVSAIRIKSQAFRYLFERNGGYMGYEAQCIEVLLAHIDNLANEIMELNEAMERAP